MEVNLSQPSRWVWVFFLMSLAFLTKVQANETLSSLLTNDIFLSDQSVLFEMQMSHAESIASLRIIYLNSNDCQSGYAGFYDTSGQGSSFPIIAMRPFGLRADAVYLAGASVVGQVQIEQINSILIRLQAVDRQFARFIGSCNDQKINCCVPVDCSSYTGTCLSKQVMETQAFMLSSHGTKQVRWD